ncbi:MAG: TIGR03364 family FAD-dependent oxidoreductase [Fuerstiella sp.]
MIRRRRQAEPGYCLARFAAVRPPIYSTFKRISEVDSYATQSRSCDHGGGVLGAFHAYHAQRRGLGVVLLDKNSAPVGATVRNIGQVVPSGMDQHWQRFGRESVEIYTSLQKEFDLSVRRLGSIYLASDEHELTLLEELRAIDAANDYHSELWSPQQCRARYPQLRPDYCRGGLFYPDEISVNPRMMIHQLHRYQDQQSGYRSYFQTCVCDLAEAGGDIEARTTDGRVFRAERAIVCSGSEFQLLFPHEFQQSDLTAVRLQMLRLKPQSNIQMPGNVLTGLSIRRYESFAQCPSWSTIKSREAEDCFWRKWGVHILFKQEADGGIILGDSHEYASASRLDDLQFDLRGDINDYFVAEGMKIFDLPSWEIEAAWYGVYCQTSHPSGIFTKTIGNNIHIVTGIGGKGMTSSAAFTKHHLKEIYND